jgi:hypothetical protein
MSGFIFVLFCYCAFVPCSDNPKLNCAQCSNNLTMTQIGPFRTVQACQTARGDAGRTREGSGLERFADECLSLKTGQVAKP